MHSIGPKGGNRPKGALGETRWGKGGGNGREGSSKKKNSPSEPRSEKGPEEIGKGGQQKKTEQPLQNVKEGKKRTSVPREGKKEKKRRLGWTVVKAKPKGRG